MSFHNLNPYPMRTKRTLFFAVLTVFLMLATSCGEARIDTLTSTSPDGDKTMTITGSKNSPLAPIMVSFLVKVKNGEVVFATEFASNELSDETCKVTWDDNKSGNVALTMRDGEDKVLDFVATDDTIHFINRFYN